MSRHDYIVSAPLLTCKISPPLCLLRSLPSFSFSVIQQWQIRMLSSKWQSAKTSIKLLIEETVGWGKGACDVVCIGMTELILQRWEVTETCQRSQSARGQPHYAVNPSCSFVAAFIDAKHINRRIQCTHGFITPLYFYHTFSLHHITDACIKPQIHFQDTGGLNNHVWIQKVTMKANLKFSTNTRRIISVISDVKGK